MRLFVRIWKTENWIPFTRNSISLFSNVIDSLNIHYKSSIIVSAHFKMKGESGDDEEVDHVVEVTPRVPVFEIKHQTREELDGIYHKSYS